MFQIGIVGCGRISNVYKSAFKNMQNTVHVSFCIDKEIERAKKFAQEFPGCGFSDSFDKLLEQKLDAVHILTPHYLHKEQVIRCLEAGFNVLTEKPIAIYEKDGVEMIETAKRCQKKLAVVSQNRYITGIVEAKRLLEEGTLGKIKGAYSTMNWHRPESYYACDWKGSWEKEGGGVVIDQAIHSLDLVRYLVNSPVAKVKAYIDRRVLTTIEVEDVANAAITFQNGVVYSFAACNYYAYNSPIHVELSCENGVVHLCGDTVEITINGTEKKTIPMEQINDTNGENYWGSCHQIQLNKFYESLASNTDAPVDPNEALETLRLVQAIYTSAKENKTVTLHGV